MPLDESNPNDIYIYKILYSQISKVIRGFGKSFELWGVLEAAGGNLFVFFPVKTLLVGLLNLVENFFRATFQEPSDNLFLSW